MKTGNVVEKPSWGKDQPNNYNGEQNCAVLDGGRNWLWNDVGCSLDYLHWICQFSKYYLTVQTASPVLLARFASLTAKMNRKKTSNEVTKLSRS